MTLSVPPSIDTGVTLQADCLDLQSRAQTVHWKFVAVVGIEAVVRLAGCYTISSLL